MNIIQDFIPVGRRNRPGRVNPMRFITIHNTGNTSVGAGARNHNAFIRGTTATNAPVSWHYTVDDREIFQHLPDNEDAFHAGDGAGNGNRQSIGIEICENSDGNLRKATDNAVWLTAELCRRHNISVDNIRQHFNWSGKNCPSRLRAGQPYSWVEFISKVRAELTPAPTPVPTPTPAPAPPPKPIEPEEQEMTQERFNEMMAVYEAEQRKKAVSNWARDAWKLAVDEGLFDGTMPWAPLTREQAAVLVDRIGLIG